MAVADALLTTPDQQAALSIAYVQAVAARAGYTCGEPPGPDRDSVDLQISAGGSMRPKLDLQCKASITLKAKGNSLAFPLKRKNYDDLRVVTQTPRLLVVLALPDDPEKWLAVSTTELMLRSAAYWLSLKGAAESDNSTSVTVSIPSKNLFDLAQLQYLMEQSRRGAVG
jgi:hypothetical protein